MTVWCFTLATNMYSIWVLLFTGLICTVSAQTQALTDPLMKGVVDQLNKDVSDLRKQNEDLQRKFDKLWAIFNQGINGEFGPEDRNGVNNRTRQSARMEADDVGSQREQTASYRVSQTFTPTPAFFATLGSQLMNAGEHQTIPFDHIVTNVGGGFNAHGTGIFRCTIPGTYVFQWTVCVADHQMAFASLIKNGAQVTLATSGRDENEYSSGTGSAIIGLDVGDEVLLQVRDPRNSADICSGFTTFSGFLLK
ncbi:C1q-related factor-like [Argopecten irradians]|uniref:C1q-related factor-like n=1 Tax=Argopecten irradians TaxID=31199 RepID=UPI00371AF517